LREISVTHAASSSGKWQMIYPHYYPKMYCLLVQKNKKKFDVCLTKLENYQILLDKISHRFLATAKLFTA
jgi:hypothetical protein